MDFGMDSGFQIPDSGIPGFEIGIRDSRIPDLEFEKIGKQLVFYWISVILLLIIVVLMGGKQTKPNANGYPVVGPESIMSKKNHGTPLLIIR